MARRNEDILIAVEIHIQKHSRPRPLGCVQPAQLRNLRISPIAAIQLQHVPLQLSALKGGGVSFEGSLRELVLSKTTTVFSTEHVHHQKVVMPIAIDVGKINSHREGAGAAQTQ